MKSTRRTFAALATFGLAVAGVTVLALFPCCGPGPAEPSSIDKGRSAPPASARSVVLHVGGMKKSGGAGPT